MSFENKPWLNNAEKKLIVALRSGEYKQAQNQLKKKDGFCCLGVACEISGFDKWTKGNEPLYLLQSHFLPFEVRDSLEWCDDIGSLNFVDTEGRIQTLAGCNDAGFTFNQIADLIENGMVKKFESKGEQ